MPPLWLAVLVNRKDLSGPTTLFDPKNVQGGALNGRPMVVTVPAWGAMRRSVQQRPEQGVRYPPTSDCGACERPWVAIMSTPWSCYRPCERLRALCWVGCLEFSHGQCSGVATAPAYVDGALIAAGSCESIFGSKILNLKMTIGSLLD